MQKIKFRHFGVLLQFFAERNMLKLCKIFPCIQD
nr:MAG TPA: hypothetical protein [Caudoviricetes sp.]